MKVRKCENKIVGKAYCTNFITKKGLYQHQGIFYTIVRQKIWV